MSRRRNKTGSKVMNQIRNEVADKSSKRVMGMDIATREASPDFYTIFQDLPNPDPVLKSLNNDIEIYQQLMYDSRVSAVAQSRKSAVLSQRWEVNGPRAKFYTEIFDNYKMHNVIGQILDSVFYGYQVSEIIWNKEGNAIVPSEFIGKPQRWFRFDAENRLRFLTKNDMVTGILVPMNKFIVSTNQATYDNPYGYPALSSVFWPVSFRKNGYKWWTQFIEKYSIPYLTASAPLGAKAEEINTMADTLQNMIQDAVLVAPEDYKISIVEANKQSSSTSFKMFLDFCNLEIAMSILGTNLTTEVSGGSYAASQSHMEVRFDLTEGDTRIVEDTFNQLIELTDEINFGKQKEKPKFNLYREESVDKTQAERDGLLKNQGVSFSEDYYRRTYNLKEADFTLSSDTQSQPEPQPQPQPEPQTM